MNIPTNKLSKNLTFAEQKALLLKQLLKQERTAVGDYAMGTLKTVRDFEHQTGLTASHVVDKSFALTVPIIRELFGIIRAQLESATTFDTAAATPVTSTTAPTPDVTQQQPDNPFKELRSLRHNPKVMYQAFQERAACDILYRYLTLNHYAVALNAAVGTGKTFIMGAVLRELFDRGWPPLVESVSIYPVLFITKATVVEQTKRVFRDSFGLDVNGGQVTVTNIDQLRCGFNKHFLREKPAVNQHGDAIYEYEWIEPLSPALLILDEAQSVKNVDSTQSLIVQKYNELDGEYHRSLYSSATMFTRVIEAKCFAVATRLKW